MGKKLFKIPFMHRAIIAVEILKLKCPYYFVYFVLAQ